MIKIGCIQFAPQLENLDSNINKLSSLLQFADSADIIVLPELCNSGYNFESQEQARKTSETIQESIFINFLASVCQKHKAHIISGFNEREEQVLFNSAVLVGPKGYVGKYQKLHLFNKEKDYFQPGKTGLPIFDLGDIKIGIQICFDWVFPESWRILALKEVDIICHPSNLVLPGLAQKSVPIHALINRVFTITANRIGKERDLKYTGLSTISNPKGEVLVQASSDREEIILVEINLEEARNKWITDRNHMFDDRRPDQYSHLTSKFYNTPDEG